MSRPDSDKIKSHYDLLGDHREIVENQSRLLMQLSVLVGDIAEVTARRSIGSPNVLHMVLTNPGVIDGMDTQELARTTRKSHEAIEKEVTILTALGLVSINSDGTLYHDTLQAEATAGELAWQSRQLRVQE